MCVCVCVCGVCVCVILKPILIILMPLQNIKGVITYFMFSEEK